MGDQNARPFAGSNEQLTGRSDPLLFAHSLYKYSTDLAQEFVKSLSLELTGSSWGQLRRVVGAENCQAPTFPLSRHHILEP